MSGEGASAQVAGGGGGPDGAVVPAGGAGPEGGASGLGAGPGAASHDGGAARRTVRLMLPTEARTRELGRAVGARLRAGDLVLLTGDLGAGKTVLTKGIAVGMGVTATVTSPTFVIARVHRPTLAGHAVPLVHVDAYRLAGSVEVDDLDLDTDLTTAAVVVEWGEGIAEGLAEEHLVVEIDRLPDDTRVARITATGGDWPARLLDVLAEMPED